MRFRKFGFFLAIGAILFLAAPMRAQTTQFTKRVFKVNGTPVNSDPSSVANGTLLDWVLTYQYNPSPAPPAQTDIRDLLPPSLQYLTSTLKVPPSWSPQWFNGSWVAAEPVGATGVGAVTAPNLTPFGAGQTVLIPPPPSSAISSASGGDGYRAIPLTINGSSNIYVLNHHIDDRYLNCFDAATGAVCAGYPAHVPLTAGTSYVGNNNHDNVTPYKTIEYVQNGRLYFAVQKNASPFEFGILCADLTTKQSCGFTPVATQTNASFAWFQGVGGANGKAYVQLPSGKLGCVIVASGTPCPGQPFTVIPSMNVQQYIGTSEVVGTNIYTTWQRSGSPYVLTCFDTASDAPCASWSTKTPDPNGNTGTLHRLLNAAGTPTGICAHTVSPVSTAFQCYALTTGASIPQSGATLPNPTSYATWIQTFGGGALQSAGLGQSGYYQSRVYNGNTGGGGSIGCYDFATQAPCPGWPVTGANITTLHYATIPDPGRPGCLWSYGDDRLLGSFQATDHSPCNSGTAVDTIITPAKSYCATDGDITAWGSLFLSGLNVGGGITATLSLYDGNNPTVPAVKADGITPYALNLPVTNFPINLGGGLGIGYGTNTGSYKSLHIVLTFQGLTSNSAWTQNPPPYIEVTWKGAPPEFCFQTRVATCEDPIVKNQATAVTTPVNGGAAINDAAPKPAFSATHLFGNDCPSKLTVTKSVPGAPAGFTGTFNFNVTCSTPNGIVQQQLSIQWPNTSVSLPNIPAGSTCTASENPNLPSLPSGYSWSGVPAITPAGGVIQITAGGANQISFVNTVRRCDDRGAVKIKKQVVGAPAGFSGTFTFNVACWAGTNLVTQQAQINYPSQSTVTVNGIPTGSTCTITETGALPALPGGWFWESPTYLPASGQVSLIGTCCPELVVINRAKFCCNDVAVVPHEAEERQ